MSHSPRVTERKVEIGNLSLALGATIRCTRAVMLATKEDELVQEVCTTIVDSGYRFCWVGAAERDEQKTVRPVAWAGYENGYLSGIRVTWSNSKLGCGPAGKAIRTSTPVLFQDLAQNSDYTPWQLEASKRGYRSSCALPLMGRGAPFGVLSIYSDQPGAFSEAALELLTNLADILSFGIANLREKEETETSLRDVSELNQQVISGAHSGLSVYDRDLRCRMWNPFMEELTGVLADEVVDSPPFERFSFLLALELEVGLRRALAGEVWLQDDIALTTPRHERIYWVSRRYVPLRNRFGEVTRVLVSLRDVTERRKAEEALRQSEQRLKQAARVSHIGIFDHDHLSDTIYWSPEQRDIYGIGPDEVVSLALYFDHIHPEDREAMVAAVRRAHDPGGNGLFDVEHRIVRGEGDLRWLTTRSQTFFQGEGDSRRKVRTVGAMLDITDRHRIEEETQKLVEVVQNSPDFIGIASPRGEVLFVNKAGQALVGIDSDEQATLKTMFQYLPTDEIARFSHDVLPTILSGKPWWGEVLVKHFRTEELIPVEMRGFPICDSHGKVIALANVSRDIRGRKQFEEALRLAEEKYRGIFDNAVLGIFQSTPDGRYLSVNQAMARMYGYSSPQEMVAAVTDVESQVYVDPSQRRAFIHLLQKQGVVQDFVYETYCKDGSRGWASVNAREVRDASGKLIYYEGTQQDITDRKRLEAQFEHAQKMEAVGRLAGGIAHDFNNILGVIIGYCDLTMDQARSIQPVARNISRVKQAADRAASLTKQLLAFSRRQMLYPQVIDLNKVVWNATEMLKRIVCEDIEVSVNASAGLGLVKVDLGQMEQILMNLAVNARDAMPSGGKIIIETSNVTLDETHPQLYAPIVPGPYVMLSFGDTGCGMDEGTFSRIFEPFFTTKAPGKGTGLGLATVYGIVQQSNGYIWAYSEPGQGATFKIYFPRVEDRESASRSEAAAEIKGGTETILLVEDEEALRDIAVILLETAGYTVFSAENATAAVNLIQTTDKRIDLAVTDVIMPDMNGPELGSRLLELRPGIKVLYVSGYAGDHIARYKHSLTEGSLLAKPFTKESLLTKVRSVLDS